MGKSIEERFTFYFDKGSEKDCWEWTGCLFKTGYGAFKVSGAVELAHRVSARILKGEDIEGKTVCHSCDNRKCVNPEHLVIADHKFNMQDMVSKRRQSRGKRRVDMTLGAKRVALRKLSEEEALAVYNRRLTGESPSVLAREFGICRSNVNKIMKGDTWSHVTGLVCRRHNFDD